MSQTILKVSGLTKTYGTKKVLQNVSFSVEKGKIYGFIGENGAGKTTAIRAVTGLSEPDEGTVELFGRSDSKGLQEGRRKMGCLVERPILAMNRTASENLKMQQYLYGRNDDAKIEKVLERVGLGGVKDKKVKDFSLGMKQRLGIAASLINDPELLILDEPVNGLDPMGMVDVRELLRSLCMDDGITIIISSHILAELYQLVTDYIIISHGRILEEISREELDRRCLSCILLGTDENERAGRVLSEKGIEAETTDDGILKIEDNVELLDVSRWMYDEGILITMMSRYERSLEDYYMELLGRC